jgi:hypothetical protein
MKEIVNAIRFIFTSHTPLGAAAASAASLTFMKLPYITIAKVKDKFRKYKTS